MEKKIVFAGDDRIQAVEHLWPRFCREVLRFSPEDVMISDESRLTDFCEFRFDEDGDTRRETTRRELATMHDRFYLEYMIDGSHTRVIVELLELLASHGVEE